MLLDINLHGPKYAVLRKKDRALVYKVVQYVANRK